MTAAIGRAQRGLSNRTKWLQAMCVFVSPSARLMTSVVDVLARFTTITRSWTGRFDESSWVETDWACNQCDDPQARCGFRDSPFYRTKERG